MNGTYVGRGIAIFKYTGGGSKGLQAMPALSWSVIFTWMLDNGSCTANIGELGRLIWAAAAPSAGSMSRTAASPCLDIGVLVLSMHFPFEVIHKNDLYMAYRAFSLFNNAQ